MRQVVQLEEEINRHFIKGLMEGYNDYLEVRTNADRDLEVSGGYAFTRGNHIEDRIAKAGLASQVEYKHANAQSWGYLQFTASHQSDEKYLVIVRRSERIEELEKDLQSKSAEERKKSWLHPLAQFNKDLDLDKHKEKIKSIKLYANSTEDVKAIYEQIELSLGHDKEYRGFYVLTYEINPDTQIIDSASLLMPNSETFDFVEVTNLDKLVAEYSDIINNSLLDKMRKIKYRDVEVAGQKYNVYTDEGVSGSPHDYGASGIEKEEQEKTE